MSDTSNKVAIDQILQKFPDASTHAPIRAYLEDIVGRLPDGLAALLVDRDGASKLPGWLKRCFQPADIFAEDNQRSWELVGLWFMRYENRYHEAAKIFLSLHEYLCEAQVHLNRWIPKGMPLVWVSECFRSLNYVESSKRYLMLTLIEDAIREEGKVSANPTGSYFRLVWLTGMPGDTLQHYAQLAYTYFKEGPDYGRFPEWILQRLDDQWRVEIPSPSEAFTYYTNPVYLRYLQSKTGDRTGKALEYLAAYLMSCMPGVRTQIGVRSNTTEYDVICSMDGFQTDFRSEFGRYFLCECKDWTADKADFTVLAKFCRLLDSVKAKFGVLFSRNGITGETRMSGAHLEQTKVFQDRAMVIVVVDADDIASVADGAHFIDMLRAKYNRIRLDLK